MRGSLIGPPLCRESLTSRIADVIIYSLTIREIVRQIFDKTNRVVIVFTILSTHVGVIHITSLGFQVNRKRNFFPPIHSETIFVTN